MVVVLVEGDAQSGPIQIEVAEVPRADVSEVYGDEATRGVREKVTKLARPLFAEAIDLARSCAVQAKQKLDEMPAETRPDEFELQFAVNLDATLGASIVGSTAGAQVQVCLRWNGGRDG
jgi:NAD(P)-dependent dehydrogenase (short-subunit alcohol dehydrogenase family)